MSLVKSIERGINSATYNPEAEKALREQKRLANEKRSEYRNALYKIRDAKTDFIQKKMASPWYVKAMDKLLKDGFDWLNSNPDAEVDEIVDQATSTKDKWAEITRANDILIKLNALTKVVEVNRDVLVKEKKINDETKGKINEFLDAAQTLATKSLDLTPEQIFSKYADLEDRANSLKEVIDINLKNPNNAVKQAEKTKEQLKKEEKAEKDSFSLKRLLTETTGIAVKVVGSLFIVMLILVSGMLTANDAIGREPMYRIFYFIYGGIGFPIMLIYYLYRWFFGTAPHIYRLLPIYTTQADTSLGRFLWFPFTYEEDDAAVQAKTKFMTSAAELVGKTYVPPAEQLKGNLSGLLEKVQKLSLNTTEAVAKVAKGTDAILAGLEKIQLPN